MSESLNYRPYQNGDELNIMELFKLSFGRLMSLDYWMWRFRDNPNGKIMIELCWDNHVLVAQYAVTPVMVSVSGNEYLAAVAMTAMTHPDYRGQGLFTKLGNRLCERLAQENYKMVWAFPNRNESHYGHIRNLRWCDICEIPMFHLELSDFRHKSVISDNIKEYTEFNGQFDDLWNEVKRDYTLIKTRDRTFLDWRFRRNPQYKYRIFGYVKGDTLLGYIIIKKYQTEVDVVEFLTIQDSTIGKNLICALVTICQKMGVTGINMWMHLQNPLHLDLEKMGFENRQPITYLVGRILQPFFDDLSFYDARKWYYTMADVDIF